MALLSVAGKGVRCLGLTQNVLSKGTKKSARNLGLDGWKWERWAKRWPGKEADRWTRFGVEFFISTPRSCVCVCHAKKKRV